MSIQRESRLTSRECTVCQSLMVSSPLPDGSELVWCENGCDFGPTVPLSDLQSTKLPGATEALMESVLATLGKTVLEAYQSGDAETLRAALFQAEDTKLLLTQPHTDELDTVIAGYRQRLGEMQEGVS